MHEVNCNLNWNMKREPSPSPFEGNGISIIYELHWSLEQFQSITCQIMQMLGWLVSHLNGINPGRSMGSSLQICKVFIRFLGNCLRNLTTSFCYANHLDLILFRIFLLTNVTFLSWAIAFVKKRKSLKTWPVWSIPSKSFIMHASNSFIELLR